MEKKVKKKKRKHITEGMDYYFIITSRLLSHTSPFEK